MIRQVCYLSSARDPMSDGALAALLRDAERANTTTGITGLLAYGAGVFFQVVEGPRDSVGAALHRIRRDARHFAVKMLQDEDVAGRDFADWRMAFRSLDAETAREIAAAADIDASAIPAIVAGLTNPLSATYARRMALAA